MPDFDTSVPHNARVYDYLLGGKDNFAADRETGDRMLVAVLQWIDDADDPAGIAGRLMAACAPGSFLTISHPASDLDAGLDAATRQFNESAGERATNRDRAAVAHLFDGYALVEPGVVRVAEWRPDSELEAARHAAVWAGVAQKP